MRSEMSALLPFAEADTANFKRRYCAHQRSSRDPTRQAAVQCFLTAIVAIPTRGVRVSVGKMCNTLINNNKPRLAPRRGIPECNAFKLLAKSGKENLPMVFLGVLHRSFPPSCLGGGERAFPSYHSWVCCSSNCGPTGASRFSSARCHERSQGISILFRI
jgi:hypothetical protein